jgi:hypothetical protein
MPWDPDTPYLVFEYDPGAIRDRVTDHCETFEQARAAATLRNRAALKHDGAPKRAPFRFWYAAGKNGVSPDPVTDPESRSKRKERREDGHQDEAEGIDGGPGGTVGPAPPGTGLLATDADAEREGSPVCVDVPVLPAG